MSKYKHVEYESVRNFYIFNNTLTWLIAAGIGVLIGFAVVSLMPEYIIPTNIADWFCLITVVLTAALALLSWKRSNRASSLEENWIAGYAMIGCLFTEYVIALAIPIMLITWSFQGWIDFLKIGIAIIDILLILPTALFAYGS